MLLPIFVSRAATTQELAWATGGRSKSDWNRAARGQIDPTQRHRDDHGAQHLFQENLQRASTIQTATNNRKEARIPSCAAPSTRAADIPPRGLSRFAWCPAVVATTARREASRQRSRVHGREVDSALRVNTACSCDPLWEAPRQACRCVHRVRAYVASACGLCHRGSRANS